MTSAVASLRSRLGLGIVVVVGGLAAGAAAWWGHAHEDVALVIAMFLVVPVPWVIRALRGGWDAFEPINLMVIGIAVLFIARPIAELILHLDPYPRYNPRPGFDRAMLIGLIGTAALYGGYFWRLGERLGTSFSSLPDQWDARRSVRFAVCLLVLGAVLTLGYMAQAGVHFVLSLYSGRNAAQHATQHASSAYFEQGAYLTIPASFILLIAWNRRKTLGTGLLLVFTIAAALFVTVPRGDRTFILQLTLPLLVLWYLRRRRRPRVLAILAAFVGLVIVANIEVSLRNEETRYGQSVPATIVRAVENPGHQLTKFAEGADPSEFTVLEIEAVALKRRLLTYQPGSTVRNILIGWIPHQFLSKPLTPLQYVSWTLFPETFGAGSYGPPMFGSMFADYGWVTLVVLSFLVGLGLRAVWEYFRRGLSIGGMQLVYAALLPLVIILLRDDIDDIFYRSVFMVLPLVVCVRICSRPPRRVRAMAFRAALRHPGQRSRGSIPARSASP